MVETVKQLLAAPHRDEVWLLKIATVMDMRDSAIRIGNIERSRALAERDARASVLSMSGGIPRASFAILGDLGMSEEAIAAYCHRFGNKRTASVELIRQQGGNNMSHER